GNSIVPLDLRMHFFKHSPDRRVIRSCASRPDRLGRPQTKQRRAGRLAARGPKRAGRVATLNSHPANYSPTETGDEPCFRVTRVARVDYGETLHRPPLDPPLRKGGKDDSEGRAEC